MKFRVGNNGVNKHEIKISGVKGITLNNLNFISNLTQSFKFNFAIDFQASSIVGSNIKISNLNQTLPSESLFIFNAKKIQFENFYFDSVESKSTTYLLNVIIFKKI